MTPSAAARVVVQCARHALARRACFAAALGGGAERVLHALPRLAGWRRLDAERLHLFMLDAAARVDTPPVPAHHLHRPRATLSRADAALHYETLLRAHFSLRAGDVPVFDVVVVDGGAAAPDDGASQLTRLVVPTRDGRGIALSPAVIRAASRVVPIGGGDAHASTARSTGPATPATSRAARTGLSRP